MAAMLKEVRLRYISAKDMIEGASPSLCINAKQEKMPLHLSQPLLTGFCEPLLVKMSNSCIQHFRPVGRCMRFSIGLFDPGQDSSQIASLRDLTVAKTQDWVKRSIIAATGE